MPKYGSEASSPVVTIIITNWNSGTYLTKCLKSLGHQTFDNFDVIIVDNGSSDDAVNGLEEKYPFHYMRIERLNSNHGFAFANNMGARLAKGKWLGLLNADAFPNPDWLEKLLKAAEENREYSFFSSRQIQANNPDFLDGAGDAYHISGLAWRHGYNHATAIYGHEPKEVFSACAAAALISREQFLSMGGFDEDYFSYFEDIDLGFRLRLGGAKCQYVPEAVIHHIGSASTGRRSEFSVYYGYRNMIWTFFKNMPSPLIWFLLPIHIGTVVFFVIYMTVRGQGRAIFRAVVDGIRGLSKMLAKRKEIQRNIKIKPYQLLDVMSTGLLEPYREFFRRNKAK